MNPFIQKVLVAVFFIIALVVLFSKYFKPKKAKKDSAACGKDDCGCH